MQPRVFYVSKRRHDRPASMVHTSRECPLLKAWAAQGGVNVPIDAALIAPTARKCKRCP
jgi:hypothetical protein